MLIILLFGRKYYALSDSQLLSYRWKGYKGCYLINAYIMEAADLEKIGNQWQMGYRWIDGGVFLYIKDDPKFGNCVYISK